MASQRKKNEKINKKNPPNKRLRKMHWQDASIKKQAKRRTKRKRLEALAKRKRQELENLEAKDNLAKLLGIRSSHRQRLERRLRNGRGLPESPL